MPPQARSAGFYFASKLVQNSLSKPLDKRIAICYTNIRDKKTQSRRKEMFEVTFVNKSGKEIHMNYEKKAQALKYAKNMIEQNPGAVVVTDPKGNVVFESSFNEVLKAQIAAMLDKKYGKLNEYTRQGSTSLIDQ